MTVLLFIIGAVALMAGATLIGFGIPINEFSFGNTLIMSGVIVFMGGLVIIALAVLASRLHRILEALATRPALRPTKPMEIPDTAPMRSPAPDIARSPAPDIAARLPSDTMRGPAPARVPFPTKARSEAKFEPKPVEMRSERADEPIPGASPDAAPTLPNPDETLAPSDLHPVVGETVLPPTSEADAGWRAPPPFPPMRAPQSNFFETMWPASKSRQSTPAEPLDQKSDFFRFESEHKPEFHSEPAPESQPDAVEPEPPIAPVHAEPDVPRPESISEKRGIAVLKAGVVDGMSYTLYVDGSIEAELPQGTLHFASINELRAHLEKHS
jgi:hypothetical protein